jgi:cell wall-associated NlpC family hydrolase
VSEIQRKLVVTTAQGWFDAARDSSYSMGKRLLFMENALNHTENALVAARQERDNLQAKIKEVERNFDEQSAAWSEKEESLQAAWSSRQSELDDLKDDYIPKIQQQQQQRANLQAAYGVLREALKTLEQMDYREEIILHRNGRKVINKALATTPTEARELTTVIDTAKLYIGTPFIWGGNTPTGFDCSGFTQYVMKENGITIPRSAAEQYATGAAIDKSNLKPGDLVFFTTYEEGATHVGFYIGDDKFIHASLIPEPGQITISLLTEQYYTERYIGARRHTKDPSTEAGERVRGLVEAMTDIRRRSNEEDVVCIASDALAKFTSC